MTDRRVTEGLHGKYFVNRVDGTDAIGEKHHGCTYFVLDLQHDRHMPAALRAYAESCEKDYPALARDLRTVANDFGSRSEFAGITAQKPALDLERLRVCAPSVAPPSHIVDFAVQVAGQSPCQSKRGVVIFDGDNVITNGYNVKPRGFDCDGSDACKATCRVEAVHAEQIALLAAGAKAHQADLLHVKTVNGQLVPSGGPSCIQCSKLALVAGIAGVWLYHDSGWRRYKASEFHTLSLRAPSVAPEAPTEGQHWHDHALPRSPAPQKEKS